MKHSYRTYAVLFAILIKAIPAMAQKDPLTASLSGQVLDPAGAGISLASIILSIRGTGAATSTVSGNAGADGKFSFSNLPAGVYQLCAGSEEFAYLDSCLWSSSPPVMTVAAGQQITNVQVKPVKGVPIKIRLDDVSQTLKTKEGSTADHFLIMTLRTPSGFLVPPRLISSDSTGRDYGVVIPSGTVASLLIHTKHFVLSDALGVGLSPLLPGKVTPEEVPPIIVPIAATLVPITVKVGVTGSK